MGHKLATLATAFLILSSSFAGADTTTVSIGNSVPVSSPKIFYPVINGVTGIGVYAYTNFLGTLSDSQTITVRWEANLQYTGAIANRPTSYTINYDFYNGANASGELNGSSPYSPSGGISASGSVQNALADIGYQPQQSTAISPYAVAGPLTQHRSKAAASLSWVQINSTTWRATVILESITMNADALINKPAHGALKDDGSQGSAGQACTLP